MRGALPLLHAEAEARTDHFREVAFSEADAGRGYRECAPGAVAARCSRREAVRGLTRNGRFSTLDQRAYIRCREASRTRVENLRRVSQLVRHFRHRDLRIRARLDRRAEP